jgi:hypothetical protein
MVFSCFCSSKKNIEILRDSNIEEKTQAIFQSRKFEDEKLIRDNNIIKLINGDNTIINEKILSENTIVTAKMCRNFIVACTKMEIFLLKQETFEIVIKKEFEDEILSSAVEKARVVPKFYIGFKSGKILVFSVRDLGQKIMMNEIWTYHCFRPVYEIAVSIEQQDINIKRTVYAGFSKWGSDLVPIS